MSEKEKVAKMRDCRKSIIGFSIDLFCGPPGVKCIMFGKRRNFN